jgi:FKBP-type peptidyl-prolyl cis-trans isomerase FkpA
MVAHLGPFRYTLVALAALAAVAGCSESPTAPSGSAPYSQTDLVVGTGAEAVAGAFVSVAYDGWFYDESKVDGKGVQFDSSARWGAISFTLGVGDVIAGFDQGVTGMRVGGQRRIVVPPSLAYGGRRNGPIPPNATLVFDLELLSVD